MKAKYLMFLALACFFLISVASAEVQSLPSIRQGECAYLEQTCSNCTYVNLESVTMNKQPPTYLNLTMTKQGNSYNYTWCNTSILGKYIVKTCGDVDGANTCVPYDFIVGGEYTSAQSLIAIILFIFLGLIFISSIYGFMVIPFNNPRTPEGEIVNVDFKKYLKIGLFGLAYVCLVGLIYFSWNLSYGILQFTEMANFFYILFRMSFIFMFLALPSLFIVAVFRFAKDMKIYKDLMRGLTVK
jgi:hypothetical protein